MGLTSLTALITISTVNVKRTPRIASGDCFPMQS